MTRAASYAERVGALGAESHALRSALELWYLRTRFAYRIPVEDVVRALARHPGGAAHWSGGPDGRWRSGAPPRP